jgi:hypothetical protein
MAFGPRSARSGRCRSVHGVLVGFLLGSALALRVASASPKFQGVAETSIGYTDNIQSVPSVPLPGEPPKAAGAFVMLSPGIVMAEALPRLIYRLKYTYTYDLFFEQTDLSNSSNQLELQAFYDVSPRVAMVVGANVLQSNQYSALILLPPGAGTVNATPAGSENFLSASANELVSVDLAPDLRGYEGVALTEVTPLFSTVAPRTFEPTGRVGVERTFVTDAVGAEARGDYSYVQGALDPDGAPLGDQSQVIGTAVGTWRRDWGRSFASRIEAGALRLQRLNTDKGFWEPTGRATLSYVPAFGDAELSYDHTVTTNPLLGQTLVYDEAWLRGAIPLTKKGELLAAASCGYQSGRLLDENAVFAAHINVLLADVGLGWQATDTFLLGLRYQHIQQISDAQVPPLPLSYVRNTVLLGATFRFPPEREMPRAYRAPERVDRSDEIRDAIQPPQTPSQPGGVRPGT